MNGSWADHDYHTPHYTHLGGRSLSIPLTMILVAARYQKLPVILWTTIRHKIPTRKLFIRSLLRGGKVSVTQNSTGKRDLFSRRYIYFVFTLNISLPIYKLLYSQAFASHEEWSAEYSCIFRKTEIVSNAYQNTNNRIKKYIMYINDLRENTVENTVELNISSDALLWTIAATRNCISWLCERYKLRWFSLFYDNEL